MSNDEGTWTDTLRGMKSKMVDEEDKAKIDDLIQTVEEDEADFIFPPAAWAAFKKWLTGQ